MQPFLIQKQELTTKLFKIGWVLGPPKYLGQILNTKKITTTGFDSSYAQKLVNFKKEMQFFGILGTPDFFSTNPRP